MTGSVKEVCTGKYPKLKSKESKSEEESKEQFPAHQYAEFFVV